MSQPSTKENELPPAVQGVAGDWIGAQKWDYADVQEWLDHLKLSKYREKFFEWGIDGRILMEMKKEDFELLGLLDRKELTKINNSIAKLRATKAGEETYWIPTSRMPKADPAEVSQIFSDLGDWVDAIGEMDDALQKEAEQEHETTPNLPPVRGNDITLGAGIPKSQAPITEPRKLSAEEAEAQKQADEEMIQARKDGHAAKHTHNYFDQWDKFNVDKELDNLDDESEDEEEEEEEVIEMDGELPPDLAKLRGASRTQAAVREKDTGNEYIRSGEPKRAIRHYNRSVELDASVGAVYANRALAHLKLKNFKETENDCDIALARGGDPVKVHFRRGLSRKEQSNWAGAHDDFEKVLLLDPEQKDAAKERDAMKKKLGLSTKTTGGKRMKIVETDSEGPLCAQFDPDGSSFIASPEWVGSKPGYIFRMGAEGLGYYTDPTKAKQEEASEEVPKKKKGKKIMIEEVESMEETSSKPAEAPKKKSSGFSFDKKAPSDKKKKSKKIQIEEVEEVKKPIRLTGGTQEDFIIEEVDSRRHDDPRGEPVKPKTQKKKIQIEEVDSTPKAEEPVKKTKKKIQIEEVDSAPKAEEPVKKTKKKIQIEEVDSTPKAEEPVKKTKKKIQIEEVDSTPKAEEPVKKTKKKIQIEEVGESTEESSPKPAAEIGAERAIPASLFKAKPAPKTGYEFERNLDGCKTPKACAEYMSLVKPTGVTKLLKQNLTPEMLMQLVDGLEAGLEGGAEVGMKWLAAIPKVNRFDIIVQFLSDTEKARIGSAVDKLVGDGATNAELVSSVRKAFGL